jgi:putative ABC transport system permease protein
MFKNLLKISIRTIWKDKTYSLINIIGLTIGITCSLFLLLYILHEVSYDRYHVNAGTSTGWCRISRNLTTLLRGQ